MPSLPSPLFGRRIEARVPDAKTCPASQKKFDGSLVSVEGRPVKGRCAEDALCVHGSPVVQQVRDDVFVAVACRRVHGVGDDVPEQVSTIGRPVVVRHRRGAPSPVAGQVFAGGHHAVDVIAFPQRGGDDYRQAAGPAREEHVGYAAASQGGCPIKGCGSPDGLRLYLRAGLKQQAGNVGIIGLGGPVQAGLSMLARTVHQVRSALQQQCQG